MNCSEDWYQLDWNTLQEKGKCKFYQIKPLVPQKDWYVHRKKKGYYFVHIFIDIMKNHNPSDDDDSTKMTMEMMALITIIIKRSSMLKYMTHPDVTKFYGCFLTMDKF